MKKIERDRVTLDIGGREAVAATELANRESGAVHPAVRLFAGAVWSAEKPGTLPHGLPQPDVPGLGVNIHFVEPPAATWR